MKATWQISFLAGIAFTRRESALNGICSIDGLLLMKDLFHLICSFFTIRKKKTKREKNS